MFTDDEFDEIIDAIEVAIEWAQSPAEQARLEALRARVREEAAAPPEAPEPGRCSICPI